MPEGQKSVKNILVKEKELGVGPGRTQWRIGQQYHCRKGQTGMMEQWLTEMKLMLCR